MNHVTHTRLAGHDGEWPISEYQDKELKEDCLKEKNIGACDGIGFLYAW